MKNPNTKIQPGQFWATPENMRSHVISREYTALWIFNRRQSSGRTRWRIKLADTGEFGEHMMGSPRNYHNISTEEIGMIINEAEMELVAGPGAEK